MKTLIKDFNEWYYYGNEKVFLQTLPSEEDFPNLNAVLRHTRVLEKVAPHARFQFVIDDANDGLGKAFYSFLNNGFAESDTLYNDKNEAIQGETVAKAMAEVMKANIKGFRNSLPFGYLFACKMEDYKQKKDVEELNLYSEDFRCICRQITQTLNNKLNGEDTEHFETGQLKITVYSSKKEILTLLTFDLEEFLKVLGFKSHNVCYRKYSKYTNNGREYFYIPNHAGASLPIEITLEI